MSEVHSVLDDALRHLGEEAVGLAERTRAYCLRNSKGDRNGLEAHERLAYNWEMLSVTARLSEIVAWVFARRADIALEEGKDLPFGNETLMLNRAVAGSETREGAVPELAAACVPQPFKVLSGESRDLFARAERLEDWIESGRCSSFDDGDSARRDGGAVRPG